MSQHKEFPDTAALLGAVLRIFCADTLVLTREQIDNAPDVEMKEIFESGLVELHVKHE